MTRVDVLVVGAGPAGCSAARAAAGAGAQVLLIEQRPTIGIPVQCAEYAPAQIVGQATVPGRAISQRVTEMRTYLPDGEVVATRAAGYVLERAVFDKALAVSARRAGACIWTGARAIRQTDVGVLVRRRGSAVDVGCRLIIGADGSRSTVGNWIGQRNEALIDARQVEVVLNRARERTEVYFDPVYTGGYGWLFPKGDTANVGVGVNRAMGGNADEALIHLLDRAGISHGAVIGRTAGTIPCGGSVPRMVFGGVMLVGDAAGHTHPVTGAGILCAVVSGRLAGEAAAKAVGGGDLDQLAWYEREWLAYMGGPLRHALSRRHELDRRWTSDPQALTSAIRQTWIAFRAYGQRRTD